MCTYQFRGERKIKKEKKKKSEEKKVKTIKGETKKSSGCAGSRAFVAAIT